MPLQAPEWLQKLAFQDDPPTTIDPALISRLAAAGVEELVPTDQPNEERSGFPALPALSSH
jgi:hypothetical protein